MWYLNTILLPFRKEDGKVHVKQLWWNIFKPSNPRNMSYHADGLMQKRCNSIANSLELHLFYIKPSIWWTCGTRQAVGTWYTEHDDVMVWKHFPSYWPFVRGFHRSPMDSPHNWSATQSSDVLFAVSPDKLWNKQSRCWWSETPWRSCDITVLECPLVAICYDYYTGGLSSLNFISRIGCR